MIIGNTLLLAIVAAGVCSLAWYVCETALKWPAWLCRWIGIAIALFIFATGPIVIGGGK